MPLSVTKPIPDSGLRVDPYKSKSHPASRDGFCFVNRIYDCFAAHFTALKRIFCTIGLK